MGLRLNVVMSNNVGQHNRKREQATGRLLRPVSLTSGAQRCVQVCSMDQSEGRVEKPYGPHEKKSLEKTLRCSTWRRSKALEPGAGVSGCHMRSWNWTDP